MTDTHPDSQSLHWRRALACLATLLALAGCASVRPVGEVKDVPCPGATGTTGIAGGIAAQCPACPACPGVEPVRPAAKPIQPAQWSELPGWHEERLRTVFDAFAASCPTLLRNDKRRALWAQACSEAAQVPTGADDDALRAWFEAHFQPWALVQPDGAREGLVTGYYEPVIRGRRTTSAEFRVPVFAPPEDMVVVELAELYPELKHMRLRGRVVGNKLLPYYSRAEWDEQEAQRSRQALLWTDDPIDYFFLQIQGSGQVVLDDGSRVRLNYADQNGHPFKSIGRWLIDRGELSLGQASMQGIKAWARANPGRLRELLAVNPSMVFFRELPVSGSGPPGALAVPLTPERSIAVDPRHLPLGAPIFLATTRPNSSTPLERLMLAQDTGGAIRGVVRADFYWGSGDAAGAQAGKMRQQGRMWLLLPRGIEPDSLPGA